MTHWGWYWGVKRQNYIPKTLCSNFGLNEIDSFHMYNAYYQVEAVRESESKCALEIPRYELKAYLQADDSLLVEYAGGSYLIPVERKPCNFGGYYYFFHCPLCKKRMRKLYCIQGQYQCRRCGNLGYLSQRFRPKDWYAEMQNEVEKYVKNRGGNLELNEKPPRMHKKTFERLKAKAEYCEGKSGLAEFADYRKWYGSRAEDWLDKYFEFKWHLAIKKYKG